MTREQASVLHISFKTHIKLDELAFKPNSSYEGKDKERSIYRTIGMKHFDVDPVNISA
jgi:hypothetical protein